MRAREKKRGKRIMNKRLLARKEKQSGRRKGETEDTEDRGKTDGVRFPRR